MVDKYAKDNALYPVDVKLRAKINERLFYVGNYIFPRIFQILVGGYFRGETEISQTQMDEMMRGYSTIEAFLENSNYLSGSTMTLADLYLWANMESFGLVIPIDKEKFPKFDRWLSRMREHPSTEMNKKCGEEHIAYFKQCVAKNLAAKQ